MLKTSFGIDEDPFHEYDRGMGWRAPSHVSRPEDEYERALSPGAREVLERAGKLRPR